MSERERVCVCKQLLHKTSCSRQYFYVNMEPNVSMSITFSTILHIYILNIRVGCGGTSCHPSTKMGKVGKSQT